jgi:hypothetical protein
MTEQVQSCGNVRNLYPRRKPVRMSSLTLTIMTQIFRVLFQSLQANEKGKFK